MSKFTPHTEQDVSEMLSTVGVGSLDELFSDIPKEIRLQSLELQSGKREGDVYSEMRGLASKNRVFDVILRGAGAYDHYIPAVVNEMSSRSEFVTAYTPYQAEMSQGILQSIFEYQTMIANLTGLDVTNASHYDGATAAAEALLMTKERNRNKVFVPCQLSPNTLEVIRTYLEPQGITVELLPQKNGRIDIEKTEALIDDNTAAILFEQPNFYGNIEDADSLSRLIHEKGGKLVSKVYPISLGILKKPSEYKADIAVGEGQSLGLPLSFGGPYLGFMAATKAMQRKLPGRIVGETVDKNGKRCYVLTLQAREQHIRREKASSNICSNEAYCALRAGMYLASLGEAGLREVATSSVNNAHYLAGLLQKSGLVLKYDAPFFNEFVTVSKGNSKKINTRLSKNGILGGLALNDDEILWCVTEKVKAATLRTVSELVGEVVNANRL